MRRGLNAVNRVQTRIQDDARALGVLRSAHQRLIESRDQEARSEAARLHMDASPLRLPMMSSSSDGSLLQRPVPDDLQTAKAEFDELAESVRRSIDQYDRQLREWESKFLKRSKRRPPFPQEAVAAIPQLQQLAKASPRLEKRYIEAEMSDLKARLHAEFNLESQALERDQEAVLAEVRKVLADIDGQLGRPGLPWTDPRWRLLDLPTQVESAIRIGRLELRLPRSFGVSEMPALIDFPFSTSLVLVAPVSARERAQSLIRSLTLRLLVAVPPGGLNFVVFDPLSLGQSVSEFRHLSEYDSGIMDIKTWTSERDIERRLDELCDHIEVVISNYLRGQFTSIEDYNRHAGEVAEPYRVLLVHDFPSSFSDRAARQLLSLMENGPRCGIHVVLHVDPDVGFPRDITLERVLHKAQQITWREDRATLTAADPIGVVDHDLVTDDAAPIGFEAGGEPATHFAEHLQRIGQAVSAGSRSGPVTLETIFPIIGRRILAGRHRDSPELVPGSVTPNPVQPGTWWSGITDRNAAAPIGRAGAQDAALLNFSSTEVAGGAIMVGVPRSGKSTALHALITSLSIIYSPDELELYLVDSKHGVEFKAYESLPHARLVSINSERDFSLAVLKSLDHEIGTRAEKMKRQGNGASNLTEYRERTGGSMPRVILVMDEFHEVFEEDDATGREAFQAFSNIVRQGPFAGIHVVVASQTLASIPAMDSSTLRLLPMRIAFMCNDTDADMVMGDLNREVKALSRQGEGILNPLRGDPAHNKPFVGMYIEPSQRAAVLAELNELAARNGIERRPRVFDGDRVADRPPTGAAESPSGLGIPFGEPYDLEPAAVVSIQRSRGSNVLLVGATDPAEDSDPSMAGAIHSVIAAAMRCGYGTAVLDFSGAAADPPDVLTLSNLCGEAGIEYGRGKRALELLDPVDTLIQERVEEGSYDEPGQVLVLRGLQRAQGLEPEEAYKDSQDDQTPGDRLARIIRDGPDVGVHCAVLVDNLKQFDRRLGRDLLREFDFRIVGSAAALADIAVLTDSYKEGSVRRSQLLSIDNTRGKLRRMNAYPPYASVDEFRKDVEASAG